jgi:hypothetical protein
VGFGCGAHEHDLTLTSRDDKVAGREERLPVSVAPALPLQLAVRGVDTGEDPRIEPVDEALVMHRALMVFFIRFVRHSSPAEKRSPPRVISSASPRLHAAPQFHLLHADVVERSPGHGDQGPPGRPYFFLDPGAAGVRFIAPVIGTPIGPTGM